MVGCWGRVLAESLRRDATRAGDPPCPVEGMDVRVMGRNTELSAEVEVPLVPVGRYEGQ